MARRHVNAVYGHHETISVSPATKALIVLLENEFDHVCADNESLGLAGAGITTYGDTKATDGVALNGPQGSFHSYNRGSVHCTCRPTTVATVVRKRRRIQNPLWRQYEPHHSMNE